jgi:mRNA-degrading endonuclease toxin of MazEF toxin-antitoxin module
VTPDFPRRGFIHLVRFPGVEEPKTALVVSTDLVNEHLRPVVVQVTKRDKLRPLPTVVRLRAGEGGLDVNSYALCHELLTPPDDFISPDPLGKQLEPLRMAEIDEALAFALDLDQRLLP